MPIENVTWTQIVGFIATGIIALSALIEITPIKLNPWSWIAKKVGRALNQELIDKVDKLEEDIEDIKRSGEEQNAKDNRTRILRFGDELRLGVKHSKESFQNILETISDYDRYCADHSGFRNKITEINEKYIAETFEKCLKNNTFL